MSSDIAIQLKHARAEARELSIGQCSLLIEGHRYLRELIQQFLALFQQLFDFSLFATLSQLLLRFPTCPTDS
jgi:hypothetical protein